MIDENLEFNFGEEEFIFEIPEGFESFYEEND